MMKTLSMAVAAVLVIGALSVGCSGTDPDGTGTVEMTTSVDNGTVSRVADKTDGRVEGQSRTVEIERVRILLSRLKFKRTSDDTSGGRDVKTGPAVVTFTMDSTRVFFKEPVPVGTYDRVKLEKHKFSSSEADQYLNDPVFGPFASPERITIIIEGVFKEAGSEEGFVIQDDATENVWINFDSPLTVEDGATAQIEMAFDAALVFKQNGVVLDPFNDKDRRDIFKNLNKAFKLQNKKNK